MKSIGLALGICTACVCQAFVLRPVLQPRSDCTRLWGFMDALKKGFENEVQDKPAANPGLKSGAQTVKLTFQPYNRVVEAVPGQRLSDVAAAARVPVKYNCKKGECGTCTVTFNGRKIKTCQSIVPRGEKGNQATIVVP